MIVAGLMSGTSADGTDVALVEIDGAPPQLHWQLLYHLTVPHSSHLRAEILTAMRPITGTVDRLCRLNVSLGEQFAQALLMGLRQSGVKLEQVVLIGCHGQTVWHAPNASPPATLQLGEAAVIAQRTNRPVVSNFRARDMAAGGQGAPLVAYVDVLLLTHDTLTRAVQNIGGIGNVTFLPPGRQEDVTPFAFDTGPGNVLIDQLVTLASNGRLGYDRGGELAARGVVDLAMLDQLLDMPYFRRPPPKTTGRELFTHAMAKRIWQEARDKGLQPDDVLATVTALTARSVGRAYRDFLPMMPDEVIVSGGGALNPTLMDLLAQAVAPARLRLSDEVGIPVEAKEALAFAILAYETWHGRPGNLPAATGAGSSVLLGQITPAGPTYEAARTKNG